MSIRFRWAAVVGCGSLAVASRASSRVGGASGECGSLFIRGKYISRIATVLAEGNRIRTGKHGDFVDIVKFAVALTFKAGPEVGDQDLRPLVEPDSTPVKGRLVSEAGKVLCEQVHQCRCRLVGVINAIDKAAVKFLRIVRVKMLEQNY